MDERIQIRNGDYHACILLDGLAQLTLKQVSCLFRCMSAAEWENRETIALLARRLPEIRRDSESAWRFASQNYVEGYKHIQNPKRPDAKTRAQQIINRSLLSSLKCAKAQHDRWNKVFNLFHNFTQKGELN